MGKLNNEQVTVLMREGTFHGIEMLQKQNKITAAEASEVLARSYGALLEQVEEAKKELQHIQSNLMRLEAACRQGKQARGQTPVTTTRQNLGDSVVNLDNWIVSLMETNLTITGMLNPALTRNKITQFGIAMNALMDKRAAEKHPVLDDPSLFSGYVNW